MHQNGRGIYSILSNVTRSIISKMTNLIVRSVNNVIRTITPSKRNSNTKNIATYNVITVIEVRAHIKFYILSDIKIISIYLVDIKNIIGNFNFPARLNGEGTIVYRYSTIIWSFSVPIKLCDISMRKFYFHIFRCNLMQHRTL